MSQVPVLFLRKAQNPGYTRRDGTYVKPFNDRRPAAKPPAKKGASASLFPGEDGAPKGAAKWGASGSSMSLFGDGKPKPPPPGAVPHPKPDEHGKAKMIHYPTKPTDLAALDDPSAVAVFTPGSAVPASLHGVEMAPWTDAPEGDDWDFVDGQNDDLVEPPIQLTGKKNAASGVIVQEPDGRVWIISPTNQYAGVMHTFPKGGVDEGLSYQANAIKEAYEESGLKVEIDAHALDVERTTSVARYYLAHRVGGSPADMGWESQAVRLVPLAQLGDYLNRPEDKEILEFLRARAEQAAP